MMAAHVFQPLGPTNRKLTEWEPKREPKVESRSRFFHPSPNRDVKPIAGSSRPLGSPLAYRSIGRSISGVQSLPIGHAKQPFSGEVQAITWIWPYRPSGHSPVSSGQHSGQPRVANPYKGIKS